MAEMAVPQLAAHQPTSRGAPPLCIHCENPIPMDRASEFCCPGCDAVYHWIQEHRLQKFYDIKSKGQSIRKPRPISESIESFDYLNDPNFLNTYSWITPEGRWMDFYVEGVHCAACIWLTEKIAEIVDHVGWIRLNLGTSVATVRIHEEGSFAAVALELQKMGYRPHPIKRGESKDLQKKENRLFLIRVGVAAACAGNIMLLAVSLYGGASGLMAERFRWISLGLFLPVIFFSAVPFYQSAWAAIQSRQLSIDIPVVFGILLGFLVSVINLISGDDRIYFDSLAALVFLLLSTRYLLKRAQQVSFDSSQVLHFLTPVSLKKWNSEHHLYEDVPLEQVSPGDRIQILPTQAIPVDGKILTGTSYLDCSLLTGESRPQKVNAGDVIFAGTMNLDSPLEVEVTQSGSKTRVGRILDSMEVLLARKAKITVFADRVSKYFIGAVVILSAITFGLGFHSDWHTGFNRALAIAIVTCPCTFALITPLAFSLTLGRLAKAGVLIKGADVLEKFASIQSIFLDKTGTLTQGSPEVVSWEAPEDLPDQVLAIESHSTHPVAKALVAFLKTKIRRTSQESLSPPGATPRELKETLGIGIRARIGEDWLEIRRADPADPADAAQNANTSATVSGGSEIAILKNDKKVGKAILVDPIRPDSQQAVQLIESLGLKAYILSGDHRVPVLEAGQAVGIPADRCYFEKSPENKCELIQNYSPSLMVGDGANDAMSLAQAFIGIAVHGGVEISLRAADIYLRKPGVLPIYDLIVVARETLKVVRRNLGFSIIYNLIAGGFALAGKIDPLFAAILMPLSASTVYLSSIYGTRKMKLSLKRMSA